MAVEPEELVINVMRYCESVSVKNGVIGYEYDLVSSNPPIECIINIEKTSDAVFMIRLNSGVRRVRIYNSSPNENNRFNIYYSENLQFVELYANMTLMFIKMEYINILDVPLGGLIPEILLRHHNAILEVSFNNKPYYYSIIGGESNRFYRDSLMYYFVGNVLKDPLFRIERLDKGDYSTLKYNIWKNPKAVLRFDLSGATPALFLLEGDKQVLQIENMRQLVKLTE